MSEILFDLHFNTSKGVGSGERILSIEDDGKFHFKETNDKINKIEFVSVSNFEKVKTDINQILQKHKEKAMQEIEEYVFKSEDFVPVTIIYNGDDEFLMA